MGSTTEVAFYCVADANYFLGAVGMINSLRVVGHDEPVYLLDCGLTEAQREVLGPHVTVVRAESDTPPWLLKSVAPLAHPAETMVLLDADLVAVRRLDELIEIARPGKVVAFANNMDRYVPEWGELLELGTSRRQTYLCSACVALGRDPGDEVLGLMESRRDRVDFQRSFWRSNDAEYPFLYGDQDVLNAILSSRIAAERTVALDTRLAPAIPFEGLELADERSLRCTFADGTEPYVVHHILPVKPWREPAYDGVYSQLLRRLLSSPDVPIRVTAGEIPLALRRGRLAAAAQKRINLRQQIRWRTGR